MNKYIELSDYCWTIDEPDMAADWLKAADRIKELEAENSKIAKQLDEFEYHTCQELQAKLEKVRELQNQLSTQTLNSHVVKQLKAILEDEL